MDDIVARHVLATAELDVQSVAEVGERVAGDDRVDRRQPEDEIVVLAARVRPDAERPRTGTMEMPFAFARAQPGEVVALHSAHVVGIDAELLDPISQVSAGGVCTGRPNRRASRSWYGAVRTTAVARSRSSSGTESGSNNRKSSSSSTAYDETSSGHHCSLSQSGCEVLPVPDPGAQFTHGREAMCVGT